MNVYNNNISQVYYATYKKKSKKFKSKPCVKLNTEIFRK